MDDGTGFAGARRALSAQLWLSSGGSGTFSVRVLAGIAQVNQA